LIESKLIDPVLRQYRAVLAATLTMILIIMSYSLISAAESAESVDALQSRIAATSDRSTLARLHKQLGDQYLAQDRITEAAEAYGHALETDRDQFSSAERVQMAVYLSWADNLKQSERELRAVLARDPKHREARTHLARVLSWRGELSEAVEEADKVLNDYPNDREASLVKADALQWRGNYSEAIPLYRRLAAEDNFDARVGLSRSQLATGNRTASVETMNSLKPGNARQERELMKLRESIDQETRPLLDARYNYFSDSDDNRLNRYSLSSNFSIGNQKLGVTYRHTDAENDTRDNRAEDLSFRVYTNPSDQLTLGGGLGLTQLRDGRTSTFPTGHLRIDTKLFRGAAGATLHREVLSETAELIENRIRMTNVGLYLSQPLTDRITVYAGYNYKDFSDGNHANDVQLVSQYALYFNPRIAVGHRFRFLDFHKQSGSGFFDPSNYIANRVFTSYWLERDKYYTYLEGYFGYETFRRNRVASDNFIYGGSGSIGFKPISTLAIEFNAEGGTFAAGSASGFNYFVIGPRVLFRF
jgi:tetratricopeptide (TPR) repeat protein